MQGNFSPKWTEPWISFPLWIQIFICVCTHKYIYFLPPKVSWQKRDSDKCIAKTTSTTFWAHFPGTSVQVVHFMGSLQVLLVIAQCCHTTVKVAWNLAVLLNTSIILKKMYWELASVSTWVTLNLGVCVSLSYEQWKRKISKISNILFWSCCYISFCVGCNWSLLFLLIIWDNYTRW